MGDFTHINKEGRAKMVDVSGKDFMKRTARATGSIFLSPETISKIRDFSIKKGDVLSVAKIAGISAAKTTSNLIPLCHNIRLEHVDITFEISENSVKIESSVVCTEKTGAEMEALTAVSVAALTIYDMCKAVDKHMRIGDILLISKSKEAL